MTNPRSPAPADLEAEYAQIETALADTARGRWFLVEHARRSRRAETDALLDSIARFKAALEGPAPAHSDIGREIALLRERAAAAVRTLEATGGQSRPAAPDATERIVAAAEEVHELAWRIQGRDVEAGAAERIARQAALIYAATTELASERERHARAVRVLAETAERLALLEAMLHDGPLPARPAGDLGAIVPRDDLAALARILKSSS